MSEPKNIPAFPKAPLYAVFAIIVFTLVSVTIVQLTGTGGTPRSTATAAKVRDLRFVDRNDGSVAIIDMASNAEVGELAKDEEGFVRGILRSMARERRANGVGNEPPLRLTRRTDGTVFLLDPSTGRDIELDAFGHTNEASFERLLDLGSVPPRQASTGPTAPVQP